MNGITCRNCRTVNPLGSKFCNNCGTLMPPQTTQTCANCGMANPQNRLYCDNCGHRLVTLPGTPAEKKPAPESPATPPSRHGFVLPARRPGDTGELDPDDLPEWLKTGERPSAEPDPERQSRISDWLQELTELKDEEDPDRLTVDYGFLERPKWPGRERAIIEETGKPGETVPEDFFQNIVEDDDPITIPTAWLKGDTVPDDSFAPPPDTPPAETTENDFWLADMMGQQSDLANTDITDDWLNSWEADPPPDSSPTATPSEEEELADWSPDLAAAEPPSLPEEPGVSPPEDPFMAADWLAELELPEGEAEEAETNSWDVSALTPSAEQDDLSESGETGFAWGTAEAEPTALPDWLAEQTRPVAAEEDETTPEWLADFALDRPTTGQITTDDSDLPDWLDDLDAAVPTNLPPVVAGENDTTFADAGTPLPDWLNEWREDAAAEPPTPTSLPDWSLADSDEVEALAEEEPQEEPGTNWPEPVSLRVDTSSLEADRTAEEIDLSGWLEELETENEGQAEADVIAAMPLAEDDLPQWWTGELDPKKAVLDWAEEEPAAAVEPITPQPTIPAEIPDWLAELRSPDTTFFAQPEPETSEPSTLAEPVEAEETPEWMDDLMGGLGDEPASIPPTTWEPFTPEPPASDWLTQEQESVPLSRPADEPHELVRGELPEWLQQSLKEGNVVATSGRSLELPDLPLPQGDLPEWLGTSGDQDFDSALEAALSVRGSEMVRGALDSEWADLIEEVPTTESGVTLERAEIPEWIQELRPRTTPEPEPEAEQITGPLTGMRGVIPVEPVIAQPKVYVAAASLFTVTKEQQQQAALLHQLVHSEAKSVVKIGPQRGPMALVLRLGLTILLLLVTVLGLLLPVWDISLPLTLPVSTNEAIAAQQAIASAPGSTVLVAFEYTPALAGELDPQARLILEQLTASGKQIVAFSQYGAGIGQAQSLDTELAGTQFVPGEALGLRSLANCLSTNGCTTVWGHDFELDLSQIELIIVLTGERESLLNWIEQVGTATEIPLVVGTTQALAPVVQPYFGSGQVTGVIAGLPGAAAYEQTLTGQAGPVGRQLQAQLLAQLLIIIFLVIGAAYYGLTGQRRV